MGTLADVRALASGAVATTLAQRVGDALRARGAASEPLFAREAPQLARVCQEMSARFLRGGRLLAFGHGACATDAQHVSVEFVHPVIVGKRALPALDLSIAFGEWTAAVARPDDIAIGFAPPEGDPAVDAALATLRALGVQTLALSGTGGGYALRPPSADSFIHQELIEILYHTLWETVHVFFEHRSSGHDVGEAGFLYPYLGRAEQDTSGVLEHVARSIVQKAHDDVALRDEVAATQAQAIAQAAVALAARIEAGGKLIMFGNGGSATDANDFALDCVAPPAAKRYRRVPALSLALEPATISAIANDVGTEVIFVRQLIAHATPRDVAIAISTSGNSRNILAALEEARRQGLLTVALLGYDGGEIVRRGLADIPLVVRSDYIPRIQEVEASIYHVLRDALAFCLDG
jgi:D-sedoheptulose 7-phosphate isomerase